MAVSRKLDDGEGWVRGDTQEVYRIYDGIPVTFTVAEAWLTVKAATSDVDGSATFQKIITTGSAVGTGLIEDTGADGVCRLRFDLTTTNTEAPTANTTYYYDIQIRMNDGTNNRIKTMETGTISWVEQVTRDT